MSAQKGDNSAEFFSLAAGEKSRNARSVALVPGEDVPLLALDLPKTLKGQAREQVARRQIQDQMGLAQDTVEMRPYAGNGTTDGWSRVLIADTSQISAWRTAAGAECRAVLPDYLSLPTATDVWTYHLEDDRVMVRLGPEDGFSTDHDLAHVMLARALDLDEASPPKALLRNADAAPEIEAMFEAREIGVIDNPAGAAELGLETPIVLGHGEVRLDLRSDPQAARNRLRRRVLPWRLPVFLGLVAAGLWAATQISAIRNLERAIAIEEARTIETVRSHFVPAGPILDVRAQVSQVLSARRTEAASWQGRIAPLTLFGQAAETISAQSAGSEQFSYSALDGLIAVLRVADFAAVDRLVDALVFDGLQVEVLGSRVSEGTDGVRAELRLSAEGGE